MKPTLETLPHVPFSRSQAITWGIRPRHLERAVRERRLRRIIRGVYVRPDVELTPILRAQAAALVTGPGCVVRDRTAAWILGVDVREYSELDVVADLEVSALRHRNAPERAGVHGGVRDLLPRDWVEIAGVRVTSPIRTTLDLGCLLGRHQALAAMDQLMRRYRFTVEDLQRELPRYFRRRGVVQLRQLVPLVDGRAESPAESWTRLEILDRGLPTPDVNFWVLEDGRKTFRLDLAYPHARICIEYDGRDFHSSTEQREYDERRRRWLRERGWRVIVVTKDSFTEEAVTIWTGEVRAVLRERSRRPAPGHAHRRRIES